MKYVIFSSSVISHNDHTNLLVFDSHTVTRSDFLCYLGITIDQYLSWFEHINAVRDKLTKGVGMLHVIHNCLPSECLLSVYNAFVMPYLIYCIELWGNACTTHLNPIQLLQKKCIRYICNALSLAHCKPLAKSIHALLFKDLYTFSVASLMYTAFHNRIKSSNLFCKTSAIHERTRNTNLNFYVYFVSTNIREKSIVHSGIVLWNNLSVDVKLCKFLNNFKYSIKNILDR